MGHAAYTPTRRTMALGVLQGGALDRVRVLLPLVSGFIATEIQLGIGPEVTLWAAVGTGAKVALACWFVLALCSVAASVVAGHKDEVAARSRAPSAVPTGSPGYV